jgi:hypothetical protein
MMASGTRWHPDPRGFLDRRLRERGMSAREFLAARPDRSWAQLVRELDEPLAPVQLMAYVQDAAARGRWLDWYARDALARALRERLTDGWRFRDEMDPQTADAFADWITTMGARGEACRDRARQVTDSLKRADLPLGWLPGGADDPLLAAAFEGVRFQDCG